MFDFSFYELVVFGIIALIVLGPEKLPQAVRTVGTYYAKFRRTVGTLKAEMEAELDLAETRQKMQEELAKIKQAEADMQKEMAQLRGSMKEFEQQQNSQIKETLKSPSLPPDKQQAGQSVEKEWVHPVASATHLAINSDIEYGVSKDSTSQETVITDTPDKNESDQYETEDSHLDQSPVPMTRPWENMWFLLGDYDRAKRLPPAPLLPNYKANPLLYNTASYHTEAYNHKANNSKPYSTGANNIVASSNNSNEAGL